MADPKQRFLDAIGSVVDPDTPEGRAKIEIIAEAMAEAEPDVKLSSADEKLLRSLVSGKPAKASPRRTQNVRTRANARQAAMSELAKRHPAEYSELYQKHLARKKAERTDQ